MAADADAEDDGGSVDLQSEEQKRLALRQQRREQVEYLKLHRAKLEKVAQRCVNRVLLQLPPDPYEALLFQLSAHVKASGIFFAHFRALPAGEDFVLEVVADARSSNLMPHRMLLRRELVAGLQAEPDVSQLQRALGSVLAGVNVLDFQ
ncbi:unnamed protein product, partial [Effrenium voratum]